MEKSQFETVMQAISGLKAEIDSRLDKSDAKGDDRFELTKTEFENVKSAMITRFDRVDAKLNSINEQVAKTHVDVIDLKARVSALEAPTA